MISKPKVNYNLVSFEIVLNELREVYRKLNDEVTRRHIKVCIERILRQKTFDESPKYISIEASQYISELDFNILNHRLFRKANQSKKLHLDHCNPVNELIRDFLSGKTSAHETIVNDFTALISKNDVKRLNENKFKNSRPNGWEKAYEISGINLQQY